MKTGDTKGDILPGQQKTAITKRNIFLGIEKSTELGINTMATKIPEAIVCTNHRLRVGRIGMLYRLLRQRFLLDSATRLLRRRQQHCKKALRDYLEAIR
jgi:hypothetical protein